MTLSTLVTVNAILGAVLVYGLLYLLGSGIHRDRRARFELLARAGRPAEQDRDRLAA
jgi:hypothetical protein